MDKPLPVHGTQSFEELKQSNEHGAEYWSHVICRRCSDTANGGGLMMPSSGP